MSDVKILEKSVEFVEKGGIIHTPNKGNMFKIIQCKSDMFILDMKSDECIKTDSSNFDYVCNLINMHLGLPDGTKLMYYYINPDKYTETITTV